MSRERRIVAEFDASTSRFDRAVGGIDKRLARFETDASKRLRMVEERMNSFDRRMSLVAGRISTSVATIGSAFGLMELRGYAEGWRQVDRSLSNLGNTSEEAKNRVIDLAVRTRSEVTATAGQLSKLARSTGSSFNETERRLETLNKLMAVAGTSVSERGSVMTQLPQALQQGFLSGDEFKSLAENAPVELMQEIAKAAGVSRAALKEFASEGRVTTEVVLTALDRLATMADERFSALAMNGDEAMAVFKTGMVAFVGRVDEALGATERLNQGMAAMGQWMAGTGDQATASAEAARTLAGAMEYVGVVGASMVAGRYMRGAMDGFEKREKIRVDALKAAQVEVAASAKAETDAAARIVAAQDRVAAAWAARVETMQGTARKQAAAERETAAAGKIYAAAITASAEAKDRAAAAATNLAVAQSRMALSARAATAATNALGSAVAFLGGPANLALMALAAAYVYASNRGTELERTQKKISEATAASERAFNVALRAHDTLEQAKRDLEAASKRLSEAVKNEGPAAVLAAQQQVGAIQSVIDKQRELIRLQLPAAQSAAQTAQDAAANVRRIETEALRERLRQEARERAEREANEQGLYQGQRLDLRKRYTEQVDGMSENQILARMGIEQGFEVERGNAALRAGERIDLTRSVALSGAIGRVQAAEAEAAAALKQAEELVALYEGKPIERADPFTQRITPEEGGLSSEIGRLVKSAGADSERIADLRVNIEKLRAALDAAPEGDKPRILAAIKAFEDQISGIESKGGKAARDVVGETAAAHETRIAVLTAETKAMGEALEARQRLRDADIARQVAEQVASEAREGIAATDARTAAIYRQKAAEYDLAKTLEQTRAELEAAKNLQRDMTRATGDAEFELSLIGKPEAQIEALRMVRERLQQIEDTGEGIDLDAPGAMFDGRPIAEWRAEIEAAAGALAQANADRKAAEAELASDKSYQRRIAEMTAERGALDQQGLSYRALTESAEIAKEAASRHADLKEAGSRRSLAAVLAEVKAEKALGREIEKTLALKQFGHDVEQRLRDLADEAAVVGKTGEEAARLKTSLEFLRKLEDEGVEITATLKSDIEEKAGRIARALSEISRRQILVDLGLEAEDYEAEARMEAEALGMKGAALDALKLKAGALRALEKEGHAATEGELSAITEAVRRYEAAKTAANIATLHFGIGEDADAAIRQIDAAVAALGKTEAEAAGLNYTLAQLEKYRNLGIDADPAALAKIAAEAERIRAATEAQMRATAAQGSRVEAREALAGARDSLAQVGQTEAAVARLSYVASAMAKYRNLGIQADPEEMRRIAQEAREIGAVTQEVVDARARDRIKTGGEEAWIQLEYEVDAVNARTDAEKAAAIVKRDLLLLQLEGVTITPDVVASIQAQADAHVAGAERLRVAQETANYSGRAYWENFQDGAFNALQDVRNLEDGLKSLGAQLLKIGTEDLWKFAFGQQTGGLGGLIFGGGKAAAKGGGGGGIFNSILSGIGSLFSFADGGVMTSRGSIPLRAYSRGGVANEPQLALFGEGRSAEAYVPLPDGRTIPVTMRVPNIPAPDGPVVHYAPVTNFTLSGDASPQTEARFQRMLEENNLKQRREVMAAVGRESRRDHRYMGG